MTCDRCENHGRGTVSATTRQFYRHEGDPAHWPDTETVRCDQCAQALRDYAALPSITLFTTREEVISS